MACVGPMDVSKYERSTPTVILPCKVHRTVKERSRSYGLPLQRMQKSCSDVEETHDTAQHNLT